MSSRLRQVAVFCGNTILGDGSVILILDPNGVAHAIGMPRTTRRSQHQDRAPANAETPAESMLVFRAGSPNPKAVPLALVTRLEEIDATTIEVLNGRPIVQYRGRLMPLVLAVGDMTIKSSGTQPLLVFSDDRRCMGLVVDEIVDIVQERLEIELVSETQGILGSAVIKGQATEVIDITHFLPLAFADWRSWKEQATDNAIRRVLLIDDAPLLVRCA
jgi:two-component system chemotaxis sensor kinase CheA